jgi:interferon-induced GTP-binding protein Mx1
MLNEALNSPESRRLLNIVDDMREILHHEKISLPHIVVVGDQSVSKVKIYSLYQLLSFFICFKVGKSSVLEALSGVQLPRAQNICTRCPLELRMKNISNSLDEYATIRCADVPEITINDFSEIMDKITDYTIKLAGTQCNVSSSPIYLTVYKRDIQEDLTLIDLPGRLV